MLAHKIARKQLFRIVVNQVLQKYFLCTWLLFLFDCEMSNFWLKASLSFFYQHSFTTACCKIRATPTTHAFPLGGALLPPLHTCMSEKPVFCLPLARVIVQFCSCAFGLTACSCELALASWRASADSHARD